MAATVLPLPAQLGLTAAAPLASALLAERGRPLALDASAVERLGGLCLQVLLSARLTWITDDQPLTLAAASPAFREAWSLFGAPTLPETRGDQP